MTQTQITLSVILGFIGFFALCMINSPFTDYNNGNLYLGLFGAASIIGSGLMIYKGYTKQ